MTVTGVDVDGWDPEAAIKRDYIAQADQVCTTTDQEVNGAYESVLQGVDPEAPPTAELFGELWTRLDPIFRDQLAALRAVSPPPTDIEALEALYGAFDAAIADVKTSVDAALAGDPAALGRLTGSRGAMTHLSQRISWPCDFAMRVCGASD